MAALKKNQVEFLAKMVPIIQRQVKNHGCKLYPSVTIAQAMLESGWGTSKRMVAANAVFGVKVGNSAYKFGDAWHGAAYKTGTTEYYDGKTATKITDWFRQYDTIEDSVCDYMDMLCHCKRYKGALSCRTPRQSIESIAAGGYATDPNYVRSVMNIINEHNLTQYDRIKDGNWLSDPVCPYVDASNKVLKRGNRGDAVKCLQWYINKKLGICKELNYTPLTEDGSFGPTTEKAVIIFQERNNLEPDGIVGGLTWGKLKK